MDCTSSLKNRGVDHRSAGIPDGVEPFTIGETDSHL
jgi:hypothetical protein